MNVVDLSREIAIEGGRIYAELMKKGEEIELNDCLIAATSLSLGIHAETADEALEASKKIMDFVKNEAKKWM